MKSDFGERLSKVMKEKNITQKELAKKIGLTREAVANYTSNEQSIPTTGKLMKICETLDCSSDYLLFGKGEV